MSKIMTSLSENVPKWSFRQRNWLLLIIFTAVLGSTYIAYTHTWSQVPFDPSVLTEAPVVGQLAPNFTLPTADGGTITLHDLRGQPVVLNFWASWCGPCRIETPHFQAFSKQYEGELIVLGVNQQESAATINEFAAEFELTYPLLVDKDNQVNQSYAVFGLPTTFFIDANGVVFDISPGAISQAVLENRITALTK